MMPYETYDKRKEKVQQFIAAYRAKVAMINSFERLCSWLEYSPAKAIPPYQELFHREQDLDVSVAIGPRLNPIEVAEAKAYFDYLMGLVSGTQPLPSQPTRTAKTDSVTFDESVDWIRVAIDQLYDMILAMTPDIGYTQDIYAMPDWMKKLDAVEKRLASLEASIDARDAEIRDILVVIRAWLATYSGVLEDARTYFAGRKPPPSSREGGGH
jgi:hypothetical protein